jgi:chromosome segregation ATPase
MRPRLTPSLALTCILALLSSCASQDCDPSRTDLFTGVGCSVGNGYNGRSQALQSQYTAAQQNAQTQSLAAREAGREAAEAQDALARRRNELAMLDRQAEALRARLKAVREGGRISEARLHAAQSSLASLSRQRQETSAAPSQAELDALKRRQQKVADIMSAM